MKEIEIISVRNKIHIENIKNLFREYQQFLGVDLSFQGFEIELLNLPGEYSPPNGELLLAKYKGEIAGCVGLRKLDDNICEMKRLYVRPFARGYGVGRKLAVSIINIATERQYSLMRLDTLATLKQAMKLYESLGFRIIKPYYHNPLSNVVYWEKDLTPNKIK